MSFVLAGFCAFGNMAFAVPEPTVDEILAAWRDHAGRIRSFAYDCEITDTRFNIQRYDVSDPFSGGRDGDPVSGKTIVDRMSLGQKMSLRVSGEKIVTHLAGEQWDYQNEKRKYFEFTSGFDGDFQYRWITGRAILGNRAKTDSPDESITNFGSQVAIRLWYSPVDMLRRLGFSPAEMKIRDGQLKVEGHSRIELSIPRGGRRWTGTVAVDPNRDFLPVRFTMTLNRIVMSDRTIQYSSHPQLGWVVKSWVAKQYTEKGNLSTVELGTVTHVSVNESISDREFAVEFPVGTQLTDVDDKTYVLLEGGKRRPFDIRGQDRWQHDDRNYIALDDRIEKLAAATPAERQQIAADLRKYVRDPASSRVNVWFLLTTAARQIHAVAGADAAISFCNEFAVESDVGRQCLPKLAAEITGQQRRKNLLGSKIELMGRTVDGLPFDAASLAGKTVLVDFWFTACEPCRRDLSWLKELYGTHSRNRFEIVGISVDTDADELKEYLRAENVSWTTIHDSPQRSPEGADANAVAYNVHSFPTYVLVDRSGKVVYAGNRTAELEELLADELRFEP